MVHQDTAHLLLEKRPGRYLQYFEGDDSFHRHLWTMMIHYFVNFSRALSCLVMKLWNLATDVVMCRVLFHFLWGALPRRTFKDESRGRAQKVLNQNQIYCLDIKYDIYCVTTDVRLHSVADKMNQEITFVLILILKNNTLNSVFFC
jgi:hypothetical protein